MTVRAIVNVATGRYVAGQERLREFLDQWAPYPDASRCFWTDQWPPFSPSHEEAPYAFKPLALLYTRASGPYDLALWMDASCVINGPLVPIWEYIEEHGMLLFEDGWTVGQWCKDAALEPLGFKSRDEAMEVPMIYACVMGFDFRNKRTNAFLDEWCKFALDGVTFPGPWRNDNWDASLDHRCLGHRHDQTAASALAHRLGIPLYKGFHPFLEIGREKDAIIQAVGV